MGDVASNEVGHHALSSHAEERGRSQREIKGGEYRVKDKDREKGERDLACPG